MIADLLKEGAGKPFLKNIKTIIESDGDVGDIVQHVAQELWKFDTEVPEPVVEEIIEETPKVEALVVEPVPFPEEQDIEPATDKMDHLLERLGILVDQGLERGEDTSVEDLRHQMKELVEQIRFMPTPEIQVSAPEVHVPATEPAKMVRATNIQRDGEKMITDVDFKIFR